MTAIYPGDVSPDSKIVSLCLSLLSFDGHRIIYDGSYEEIVYDQDLGTIHVNMKEEASRIVRNEDSQEFKRQTFIRFVNSLYSSDRLLETHRLLPFLDSLIQKTYNDVKLEILWERLKNNLKSLGYSDNEINQMNIYTK